MAGALLDAAEELLGREGMPALSVRSVAGGAGVAPMGVYNRFGSKEGLLAALALRTVDRFALTVFSGSDGQPVTLVSAARAYRTWALSNPHLYRMLFMDATVLPDGPEDVTASAKKFFDRLSALLVDPSGERGSAEQAAVCAQAVFACLHGAVSLQLNGLAQAAPDAAFDLVLSHLTQHLDRPGTDQASC